VIAGYTVLVLVIFRLFWGIGGTRHARFGDFVRRPSFVLTYLKDVVRFRGERYLGHNPAGGAMVVALLVSLLLLSLSGLALYGAAEYSGPLAGWFGGNRGLWAEILEEAHEVLADFTLALVVLHGIGVLLASFQHRENLVWSMFTGLKRKGAP
jgi:cytochrome b